jgi:alpha-1,3-rhamnosyl/mannosyltransferase
VPARDADALASAIERLLHDAAARERLRAAGLARAAQFPWSRTAALTREVYREALACG